MKKEITHEEYVKKRAAGDAEFRKALEEQRPQYEFRRALIGARVAAGLTQGQLAERLGTTQSAISRLESGSQTPTLDTLYRLAEVFGVNLTISPDGVISVTPHKAA